MGLLSRIGNALSPARSQPLSWDEFMSYFSYLGTTYAFSPSSTLGDKQEEPANSFEGFIRGAYMSNGVVFACMAARFLLFAEARFQWRQMRSGRPGDLFGTDELALLERPWPGGTTADLLTRCILDADLAGNHYSVRRGRKIHRLRPDWVTIVLGSEMDPDEPNFALDAEVIGYIYKPGGSMGSATPRTLLPEQVAHFAPIPDPSARYRGMSWLTPVIREVMGDKAATEHKLEFFEGGGTPNIAVTTDPSLDATRFQEFVALFKEEHGDLMDAYKTIFLGGGADVKVVGSTLEQADFRAVQGAGETRICAAARVPPIIVGVSEGLQAATYSNYGQARRAFADLTMRPLWRNAAGSFANLLTTPAGAELWYDDRDVAFLQEDVKDAGEVLESNARTIRTLVDGGFEPKSVVDAVTAGDLKRLSHSGKLSVQLQEPGSESSSSNGKVEPTPIGAGE
jgi:phage portal protein BeeE